MATKSQGYIYENTYSDMRGVDFSTEPSQISPHRFAYLENMYRDYEGGTGTGVETIPGYRRAVTLPGAIRALHPHPKRRNRMLIHTETALYSFGKDENGDFAAAERIPLEGQTLLADAESRSAVMDGRLCLVDGVTYSIFDGNTLKRSSISPYVPCLYIDGHPYEQKNLLTGSGYEKYHLYHMDDLRYETRDGLIYTVNHEGLCYVKGYNGSESLVVIPREVTLNEKRLVVAGISAEAFRGNKTVRTLVLPDGMQFLSKGALYGMETLETVVLPATVTEIPARCFSYCVQLRHIYLGRGLRRVDPLALQAVSLSNVHYPGDADEFKEIEGYGVFTEDPASVPILHYMSPYTTVRYRLDMHTYADSVSGAFIDEKSLSSYPLVSGYPHHATNEKGDLYVDYYYLEAADESTLYGRTFSIKLHWTDTLPKDLKALYPDFGRAGRAAVDECTLITAFDGRLFLAGNPALPGMIFYSARRADGLHDPTYIGEYNHILDGDGATPIRALLSTPSYLLVLTEGAPQSASVFRHEGQSTGDDLVPRIYPVTEGAGEIGCIGDAVFFFNDPLFLSKNGLEAVEAVTFSLSQERRTVHRSEAVDARLCREDLAACRFFRFGTYLGIATPLGHVYLADGRDRAQKNASAAYDWYYLSDIGVYRDQRERYRLVAGQLPAALSDAVVTVGGKECPLCTVSTAEYADNDTVCSSDHKGIPFCYVLRNGKPYLADTDGECHEGVFCPATAFTECDGLLYFGTATGDLMVFNTDKRGEDGVIPRRYYTFNNRAYLSGCATKSDNCGRPNYRKTTLRSGGAVKLKAMSGGKLTVRVRTDEGVWRDADILYGGRTDFSETDFDSAEFISSPDTVVPLRIGARRWIEKQLYFVSEEYQRPFGIISATYRYRAAGRI